ncbi:MAG: hypothetical protein IPQ07_38035 [Myxococcales bacterium]|nr:hypothetical protein [Myxococcales bacterium]
MIEAVLDASLAGGMDPDVAEITIGFDPKTGDASVKSTSGSGKAFTLAVPASDIASALDADVAEDAGEAPAAAPVTSATGAQA